MSDSEDFCHALIMPMLTLASFITQPNMYARGILFGKMKYELGDHSIVRCPETGLEADLEFKTKGWVGGKYDEIGGSIKESRSQKKLFELSGFWNGEMYIKDLHVSVVVARASLPVLIVHRAGRRHCSLTQHTQERQDLRSDPSRSKRSANHNVYGRSVQQPSSTKTRMRLQTRRARSKTSREKKRHNAEMQNGNQGYSVTSVLALDSPRKARKASTGSSIPRCE